VPDYELPSDLLTVTVPAGQKLVRVHEVARGPVWFGPAPGKAPGNRFDAPNREYRTMYSAHALKGAFVETVLRKADRIIGRAAVDKLGWSEITCKRELKVLKLHDNGLIFHGVTGDVCAGDDYQEPRRFAVSVHQHVAGVDGLAYRSRHNNSELCYALFDRIGSDQFVVGACRAFRDERNTVLALMREHGAVFDPMTPLSPP